MDSLTAKPIGTDALFRRIVESARHVAIISTDVDGRITYWSPSATEILGWSAVEMVGQPLARIFTPEDVAAGCPGRELRLALEDGQAIDERWHVRKSGTRFWAVGEVTPLRDDAGRAIGFAKILRDRTHQKTYEVRLQGLTDKLESLVAVRTRERDRIWRNSLDLLLEIEPGGVLRSLNPAWQHVLGYDPADLVDRHFAPFVHPEDVAATTDALARAAREPVVSFEIRVLHAAGGYRHIAWTAAPEEGLIYANGRDVTTERKQAEMLLAQNQARLRMALESGQMGVWEWDMRTDEVLLLHGADLLHGFPPSDEPIRLSGMDDYMLLVHPDDRRRFSDVVHAALSRGEDHQVEYRIVWPDGRLQWIEARGTVTEDEEGRPAVMHGVSVNITRRKRFEQDLAFLAQASADLGRLLDPQGALDTIANLAVPGFADWCAVDLVSEDGRIERAAMAHADPQRLARLRTLGRHFPYDDEGVDGAGSGSARSLRAIVEGGRPVLLPGVARDAVAGMASAATAAPSDVAPQGRWRESGFLSCIGAPLVSHGRVLGVLTFASAESGRRYDEDDLALACDLAQRAAVAIENARLYQALQKADRDKDVFLATLAHELRNPLAAISNGIAILELAAENPSRVRQANEVMKRQTGQLVRLVDDLLDVARISTGKIALRRESVDLVAILDNAVEVSRPMFDAAGHALTVRHAVPAAPMHADGTRMTQVFANLLNNAARYTPPKGRIEVFLESDGDEHVVRIRDNGIGIDGETLPHIFALFTQARHPLEHGSGGLGIGLSLVERLVTMHDGSVSASSEGPGKGSEFTVRLPAARPEGAEASAGAEADGQGWWHGKRVVVVDDNQDAATTIGEVLKMFGAQVDLAHDGLAAYRLIEQVQPDAALVDIGLPGIDGYEVARRLRGLPHLSRTTLIALTGWGQQQDRQSAADAGFDRHWVKPVTLEQLQAFRN